MKRSEMIRHMAWTWKSYVSKMDKNTPTPLKDACTHLLDSMEKEGILPPVREVVKEYKIVWHDENNKAMLTVEVNEWEPEDNT